MKHLIVPNAQIGDRLIFRHEPEEYTAEIFRVGGDVLRVRIPNELKNLRRYLRTFAVCNNRMCGSCRRKAVGLVGDEGELWE